MKVLVTGANGFVGQALCARLKAEDMGLRGAIREARTSIWGGTDQMVVGEIGPHTDWHLALANVDVVVHLAARVHLMQDGVQNPLAAYRTVNTEGTLNLARQAAGAGITRLVYLSSIKVNGEGDDRPYTESDPPAPKDPYAVSKLEAEEGLQHIARETGLEVVIIRPPLVYGPGVGANFLQLLRLVDRGYPLPFAAVPNCRSLLFLGNLVDAIVLCLSHPAAANRTYLLSDGEDVSTPELIRHIAMHMGKKPHLLSVPAGLLAVGGRLVGKGAEVQRLLGSLAVDSGRIRCELGWQPPFTLNEGLAETVRWYVGR